MAEGVGSSAGLATQETTTQVKEQSSDPHQHCSPAEWKRTYKHAYSAVGNPADAEDIAQEAYLRLFEAKLDGRKIESVVAWMKGVVRHVVIDHFRKTRPDLHVAVDASNNDDPDQRGILAELRDPSTSIEERLVDESLVLESLRILAELPERDRECVMMYARGYTFVQIASVLNIPYEVAIKTTRKALVRTRRRVGR